MLIISDVTADIMELKWLKIVLCELYSNSTHIFLQLLNLFMPPPPSGVERIMFTGCPSVRLSFRPAFLVSKIAGRMD
jgi:hypothetical protein